MTRRLLLPLALAAAMLGSAVCHAPADGGQHPPAVLAPEPAPSDLGVRALRHAAEVVSFGPRDPGSPGWQRQLEYICAELRRVGLEPRRDRWRDADEGLELENVHALIPGRGDDRIVLLCHHDTKAMHGHAEPEHNFEFVGANDGASGVGLLLALAETLTAQGWRGDAGIHLAFVDGEESREFHGNASRALFGSRRMVRRELAAGTLRQIRAVLVIDMVGAADLQIDDDDNTHRGVRRVLLAAARANDAGAWFYAQRNTVSDDHLPFVDVGVPAGVLIDLRDNPQWHTPQDTLDHLSADSLQRVGAIVLTALPGLDRLRRE